MRHSTSVVLVDDHPVVRDGLSYLLGEQSDFRVLGEAANADEALRVIRETGPDLLILDLSLEGQDAIPLIERLREERPALRILVLSMHDEELYAERLLALGIKGYVMKQEEPSEFLRALRKVAAGETYLSARLSARLAGRAGRGARGAPVQGGRLTPREEDVLRLVAEGLGTREIATRLEMSVKTVDSHRRNIREKLGLATSRDLVRYAVLWGNVPGDRRDPPK